RTATRTGQPAARRRPGRRRRSAGRGTRGRGVESCGASMRGWCAQAMVPMGRPAKMTLPSRVRGALAHPRLPRMPSRSLSIVLPAYNEEERLGPALDELFGYLHRRGEAAREGRPGPGELPETIQVLVVDDGSTDGTA